MFTLVLEGLSEADAKDLGTAADELYELKSLRAELAKKEKVIVGRMSYLKHFLLDNMPDDGLTGVCGKIARVSSVLKEIPSVIDWSTFYTFIIENNRMDLLQKRILTRSCMEMIAEGDNIPGVEVKEFLDLSIRKNS